jgi:hypothetical protein
MLTQAELDFVKALAVASAGGEGVDRLAETAMRFRNLGVDVPSMTSITTIIALVLRETGQAQAEDALLELLDRLTGFCAPGQRIN